MKLLESGENYLETILILQRTKECVRSIDVANALSISKPSVSRAVSSLKKMGYLSVNKNGYLQLSESGLKIAQQIYDRHRFLTEFFMSIGVPESTAAVEACRMEHVISQDTFIKWKEAYKKEKGCK